MTEYEQAQPEANEPEQAQDTATLLNRIEELEKQLDRKTAEANSFQQGYTARGEIISKARSLVEEEIEKGGWDTDDEFCQELCEVLDITLTEETEIEIVVRWNTTVTHPKGMNLADISVDVSDPDLDGDGCSFTWLDLVDTEINEA